MILELDDEAMEYLKKRALFEKVTIEELAIDIIENFTHCNPVNLKGEYL